MNAGQKSAALSVVGHVRSARRPPEFVIAKSIAVEAVGTPSQRVRDDIADERLAQPTVHATARSERGMDTDELPITTLSIRRELRVELVDPRLDPRVRRDADVPRPVEVGGLVDDVRAPRSTTIRIRVKRTPLLRFSVTSTPFGRTVTTWRFVVIADHDVDVRHAVRDVDERAGRLGQRAGGGALVAERDLRHLVLSRARRAASAFTAGDGSHLERPERSGKRSSGVSSVVKPTTRTEARAGSGRLVDFDHSAGVFPCVVDHVGREYVEVGQRDQLVAQELLAPVEVVVARAPRRRSPSCS